jgi:hypothetical protein
MQELNNHQIVLLTMFVSFVVSIATGIITVAMLEEAPPTLTQTVNRVVEHTIERVVTGTTTPTVDKPAVVTNITKEVTVYTKEDDLVVAAVEKNQSRTVKIFLSDADTSSTPRSIGFVVSRDGLIVAETEDLLAGGAPADTYTVVIGEKHYTAKLVAPKSVTDEPISFLKLSGMTATTSLDAVSFGRNDSPKLGQTIIVLGGADGSSVFKTTISKFRAVKSVGTSTPERAGAEVETTPAIPAHNAGALVVNLDGQAVGVVVSDPNDPGSFLICPSSCILALINLFSAPTP